MKVSKQVFGFAMSIAVGFMMSVFMSLLLLLVNVGFTEGFFTMWLWSFATAFAISIPISVVAIPLTENVLRRLFRVQDQGSR